MSDITTKTDLIAAIERTRGELDDALAGLSPDAMRQPGVCGEWSIKDVLAHITGWEQHMLRWYRAGQRGEEIEWPVPGFFTDEEVQRINQMMYEQNRDRSLDAVRADFEASYADVRAAVEAMREDEIFSAGRYAWTGEHPLLAYILANTEGHYTEHAAQIRAWRAAQG